MKEDNPQRMGPCGECVCPKCGHTVPHRQGVPCQETRCANCGGRVRMLRKGSPDHRRVQEALRKKQESSDQHS